LLLLLLFMCEKSTGTIKNKNHTLHAMLPHRRPKLDYELRPRSHDRELVPKLNCLNESNFLIRQLYKNCY